MLFSGWLISRLGATSLGMKFLRLRFLAVPMCLSPRIAYRGNASALNVLHPITRLSNRRDGVVVRPSASQSVELGFISLVESYQKTLKNGIHGFRT